MHIIREHEEENPARICHIYQGHDIGNVASQRDALVGIDEDFLAWLYIAPGYEDSETSRRLLELARGLIGPDAWAVVSLGHGDAEQDADILTAMGLQVIESYENSAPAAGGISVHLTRTVS
jgi:hypothetical protein